MRKQIHTCPICEERMIIKAKDTSFDDRNGRKYNRTVFWCKKDDVWIRVEIPKRPIV